MEHPIENHGFGAHLEAKRSHFDTRLACLGAMLANLGGVFWSPCLGSHVGVRLACLGTMLAHLAGHVAILTALAEKSRLEAESGPLRSGKQKQDLWQSHGPRPQHQRTGLGSTTTQPQS